MKMASVIVRKTRVAQKIAYNYWESTILTKQQAY